MKVTYLLFKVKVVNVKAYLQVFLLTTPKQKITKHKKFIRQLTQLLHFSITGYRTISQSYIYL